MKNRYNPYNFDIESEFKMYKKIGERDQLFQGKRKKKNARKKHQYVIFSTYNEWKQYVSDKIIDMTENTRINFYYYLRMKMRDSERRKNLVGAVIVPIYMSIISMEVAIYTNEKFNSYFTIFFTGLLAVWTFIILAIRYTKEYTKEKFYTDCMEIAKEI